CGSMVRAAEPDAEIWPGTRVQFPPWWVLGSISSDLIILALVPNLIHGSHSVTLGNSLLNLHNGPN
ncbi:hypothetical protein NDU88_002345, partial [Pleurodeles waltl]